MWNFSKGYKTILDWTKKMVWDYVVKYDSPPSTSFLFIYQYTAAQDILS